MTGNRAPFRVGTGFDFHRFTAGRRLMLGGVHIPHPQGLQGHSDADALLHAIADALLGASGLADIGSHFPDDDPQYRDMDSLQLLAQVVSMVEKAGYEVVNLDTTIIAEVPRLKPYVSAIRTQLAQVLGIDGTAVGVKATTMEGCGPIGRSEGIAAQAVVLLNKKDVL